MFVFLCLACGLTYAYYYIWASPMAHWVKNLPAMQETQEIWVQFLGWEDLLEKGMATVSSIRAWRIPWTKELVSSSPRSRKELDTTHTHTHTHTTVYKIDNIGI